MSWIAANIQWVMLVSGALTATTIYVVLAPKAALRSVFGTALEGSVADTVVRSWGVLITLTGAMLIYGAYYSEVRTLALAVAATSKTAFTLLLIANGFVRRPMALFAAISDAAMAALFVWYLADA